jgi:hypothetical protein
MNDSPPKLYKYMHPEPLAGIDNAQARELVIKWAAKVEKFQPREKFFFLTFPFIEQDLF